MATARALYTDLGRSDHFHTEAFTLGNIAAEANQIDGRVRFANSELSVVSDGTPLLLQAGTLTSMPLPRMGDLPYLHPAALLGRRARRRHR